MIGIVLATSLAPAHAAAPAIHVGAFFEYLDGNKGTLLKRVRNTGDATAFVRVEISEIVYGEDGKVSEQAVDNLGIGTSNPDHHALVASPARMIIPAKSQQAVRLIFQGNRDEERMYRVRFIPVMPDKASDFALSEEESVAYRQSLKAGVNVVTGYGPILIVRPNDVRYDTMLEDKGDAYEVYNGGNSTVIIDDFQACTTARKCSDHRKIHVRPGRTERLDKTPGFTYRFDLVEGKASRKVTF
jgi:P pilus assembly chaperone PapD